MQAARTWARTHKRYPRPVAAPTSVPATTTPGLPTHGGARGAHGSGREGMSARTSMLNACGSHSPPQGQGQAGTASDNAHKMIYVADLPKTTGYLDLSDYFEKNVGPCQICIKR